jgi:DNA primase
VGIVDEDVARVRAATDIVMLINEHVSLRRSGTRYTGLCPFHPEKTPSFSVNPTEGLYYCFGCQAKGDAITFLREIEHLDFVDAVERLAARANIQLTYTDDRGASKERQHRTALVEAMGKAVEWYHARLLESPDAAAARGYLRSRGYDGEIVRTFKLGWAPDDFDALSRSLRLSDDILRDAGLGFVNRRNRQQDAFRGRVMFPIFDAAGKPVAFGGRILPGGEGPKYKNSQETPIYSKRKVLYGLNWAKTGVVEAGEAVVCEGYTDVIAFFTAGVPRAVATCGTALADEHVRLLKGFAPRVVLAYDADNTGQSAAERFYAWEQKEQIDLRVAALPNGADPADVAREDPAALKGAVEEAKPFLAFRVERVLAAGDLRSPEGRARAAERAMAAVAEHPNELVRDQYLREIADRCRIPVDTLRARASGQRPAVTGRATSGRNGADGREAGARAGDSPEIEALRLAIHQPDVVADRLSRLGCDKAEEVLFGDELHLAAFRALASAETLHQALEQADPGAAALLHQLAVEETDSDVDEVIARLVATAAQGALSELQAEFRSAPEVARDLAETVSWLKLTTEQLEDRHTRIEAAGRLVPWLVSRGEVAGGD